MQRGVWGCAPTSEGSLSSLPINPTPSPISPAWRARQRSKAGGLPWKRQVLVPGVAGAGGEGPEPRDPKGTWDPAGSACPWAQHLPGFLASSHSRTPLHPVLSPSAVFEPCQLYTHSQNVCISVNTPSNGALGWAITHPLHFKAGLTAQGRGPVSSMALHFWHLSPCP